MSSRPLSVASSAPSSPSFQECGWGDLPEVLRFGDQPPSPPWDSDAEKCLSELASPQPPLLTLPPSPPSPCRAPTTSPTPVSPPRRPHVNPTPYHFLVLKGAQGAAGRWQARGWVGSAGPVSNIPLWKELLQLLDSTFQDILWVKVPSHVNVEGNEQADTLANNGRFSNPLYLARKTPRVQAAGQRAKRARQVAARSPPGVCPPRTQSY